LKVLVEISSVEFLVLEVEGLPDIIRSSFFAEIIDRLFQFE